MGVVLDASEVNFIKEAYLGKQAVKSIKLTKIQKLIGERMAESKRSKACFYIELKADVTELMELRPKLRKTLGVKITTNAFYVRAIGAAVTQYPLMVGVVEGENIKIAERINVGFAVSAPQGLVVPVIKDADVKKLAEIAVMEKALTEKARSNKLRLVDMEGETIALSNLGVYGVDSFVGIVPPPVSTILAVGNANSTVVVREGKGVVRKMVSLNLAVDRRVIDEVYAAGFLGFIKKELENPQQLI